MSTRRINPSRPSFIARPALRLLCALTYLHAAFVGPLIVICSDADGEVHAEFLGASSCAMSHGSATESGTDVMVELAAVDHDSCGSCHDVSLAPPAAMKTPVISMGSALPPRLQIPFEPPRMADAVARAPRCPSDPAPSLEACVASVMNC